MDRKTKKATRIVFAFLILLAFGIIPLTIAHNHGVTIHIDIVDPEGEIHYGDTVRLKCYVDGVESYFISWQCLPVTGDDDDNTLSWKDLYCYDDEYEFILTRDNVNYLYRVIVATDDETYSTNSGEPTPSALPTDIHPSETPEVVEPLQFVEEIQ